MEERGEKAKPIIYGFTTENLTPEVLVDVVKIYDETVGGHGSMAYQSIPTQASYEIEVALKNLVGTNAIDWRHGSKLSRNGKLVLWKAPLQDGILYFTFDSNDVEGLEAQKLEQQFRENVNSYLTGENIGVVVNRPY